MKNLFLPVMNNNFQKRIFSLFLTLLYIATPQYILTKPLRKNVRKKNTRKASNKRKRRVLPKKVRRRVKRGPFSETLTKILEKKDYEKKGNSVIWKQKSPINFNEFICSWNAFRPLKGKITFWVSIKHTTWSPWHRIAQWSGNDQRTFVNKRNRFVHTKHVRVEMQHKKLAKSFRIKATFSQGAPKENLKALFVCVVNTRNFMRRKSFNRPSTLIKGVPCQSQMEIDHVRANDFCSPTSLSIITHYLTDKIYGAVHYHDLHDYVIDFAEKVHDNGYLDIYGNWLLNVAEAYQASQGDVFYRVQRMNSFEDLYQNLKRKIPVAVSVRNLKGGATPYSNGHFVVVIGWDKKRQSVICIDPAFKPNGSTVRRYHIRHFLRAWGLSKNLSYVPLLKQLL